MWLVVFLILLGVAGYFALRKRASNLPPAPPGWPIIGNLPLLTQGPEVALMELSKKLGPTIAIKLGPLLQVVIHDYETAKKVFNDDNTTGHDNNFILTKLLKNKSAFEGEPWLQHRRFGMSTLRDLGMGKSGLEVSTIEEVTELLAIFAAQNGRPYDPHAHLTLSVSNLICALVFGRRFDHTDAQFLRLAGLVSEQVVLLEKAAPASAFDFLQYLPGPVGSACRAYKKLDEETNVFVEQIVAEHDDQPVGEAKDYIDYYRAKKIQMAKDPSSSFSEKMLQSTLMGFFGAGTDTTSVTLTWAMIYMVENPEVLAKVQKEIDSNVGGETVTMADKANLPYTEAVLLEIQRLASIVPFSVPHSNFEAMQIDGYDIPARTILTINSYAMHRDPQYWKHPDQFYPEHFLAEDGSVVIPKSFAPFGIGKRSCMGEALAKMSLFLFFTNLVQKFDLQRAPDCEISSKNFDSGFIRTPHPFQICFVERR